MSAQRMRRWRRQQRLDALPQPIRHAPAVIPRDESHHRPPLLSKSTDNQRIRRRLHNPYRARPLAAMAARPRLTTPSTSSRSSGAQVVVEKLRSGLGVKGSNARDNDDRAQQPAARPPTPSRWPGCERRSHPGSLIRSRVWSSTACSGCRRVPGDRREAMIDHSSRSAVRSGAARPRRYVACRDARTPARTHRAQPERSRRRGYPRHRATRSCRARPASRPAGPTNSLSRREYERRRPTHSVFLDGSGV
jgi:hypothetical protein